MFGNLVKAVVDIELNKVVVDAGLHSDEEQFLLSQGSNQSDLWGINIYPDKNGIGPQGCEHLIRGRLVKLTELLLCNKIFI